jgi:Flp pilus assembly protein TadG
MSKHRIIRREDGQALVEFTLLAPVLFLILFGIIQFGIAFMHSVALTDAVRAGARNAAVSRGSNCAPGAVQQAVVGAANDLVASDVNVATNFSPGCQAGANVTVSATYPYSINLLGLVIASGNLHSETTERVE